MDNYEEFTTTKASMLRHKYGNLYPQSQYIWEARAIWWSVKEAQRDLPWTHGPPPTIPTPENTCLAIRPELEIRGRYFPYQRSTDFHKNMETMIATKHLTYCFQNLNAGLVDISIALSPASRTLLIGANGAGKTTLLRLLAGKTLAPSGAISVAGVDPFQSTPEGVTYLGLEWVLNPVVHRDIGVRELLASIGGDHYPARRDELVKVLDIDLDWRMHFVSDGERRRVQLAMGLVRPWKVLLLDEITVDLDLFSRTRFLAWLKRESEQNGGTVVYATHILEGLEGWPTHLVHLSLGKAKHWGGMAMFEEKLKESETGNSRLGELVLEWLEDDLRERGPRNCGVGSEGTAYNSDGIGGYGLEKRVKSEKS